MKSGVDSVQFFTRKVTVKNFQNHLLASLIMCLVGNGQTVLPWLIFPRSLKIIFHRLRSKYMRQQMVGISQLVLQTTF